MIDSSTNPVEDALELVQLRPNGGPAYGRALDQALEKYGSHQEFQRAVGFTDVPDLDPILGDLFSRKSMGPLARAQEQFPLKVGEGGALQQIKDLAASVGETAGFVGDAIVGGLDFNQNPPQLPSLPSDTGFERTGKQALNSLANANPFALSARATEAVTPLVSGAFNFAGDVVSDVGSFFTDPIGPPAAGLPAPTAPIAPAPVPPALAPLSLDQSLSLGPVPQFPAAPQQPPPIEPSFARTRAEFEEARPVGPTEEQLGELEFSAILGGIGAGIANLPRNASVAEILSAAGGGALQGLSQGRARKAGKEEKFREDLRRFELAQAEAELAFETSGNEFARKKAEVAFGNKLRVWDTQIKDFQAQQPKFHGMSAQGMLTYSTVENGKRILHVKDIGLFDRLAANAIAKRRAGKPGEGNTIDLLSTEIGLDPNIPFDAALGFVHEISNRDLLTAVFGPDAVEIAVEAGIQSIETLGAGATRDTVAAAAERGKLASLAAALIADPRLKDRAIQILMGNAGGVGTQ